MRPARCAAIAVVVAGALGAAPGCAALLMDRVADDYDAGDGEPRCTSSEAWVAADGGFIGAHAIVALVGFAYADNREDRGALDEATQMRALGLVELVAAAGHLASALHGHVEAGVCREARETYLERAPPEPGDARRRW